MVQRQSKNRRRFAQYETKRANRSKVRQQLPLANKKKTMSNLNQTTTMTNPKQRCFNCGDAKHLGKQCPHKSKGSKYYACNKFGYVAAKCQKESLEKRNSTVRVDAICTTRDKKTYKNIQILGKVATAVIDSGSDLHLVRSSFYVQLGVPYIRLETIKFDGMGAADRNTLGRFTTDVTIDGLTFTLDIDVVPDHFTTHDFILDGELSNFAEVRICK